MTLGGHRPLLRGHARRPERGAPHPRRRRLPRVDPDGAVPALPGERGAGAGLRQPPHRDLRRPRAGRRGASEHGAVSAQKLDQPQPFTVL